MEIIELAIVIPAYKSEFLPAVLDSLMKQSDRRFAVYIGDDHGAKDIPEIIRKYEHLLPVTYYRFPENMGRSSLVGHWERCIRELHVAEPWINILGDDDVLPENFVASFYGHLKTIKDKGIQVVRFASVLINETGISQNIIFNHPQVESNGEFLMRKLRGATRSSLSEYTFSKEAFLLNGGIPRFPAAWFSDDSMWLLFSNSGGIYSINESIVQVRNSGLNISSSTSYEGLKLEAILQFYDWVLKHKSIIRPFDKSSFDKLFILYLQKHTFYQKLSLSDRHKVFLKLRSIHPLSGYIYYFKFLFDKVYHKIKYEKEKFLKNAHFYN